ncbi:MAG: hypothetical protein WC755_01980 [Candidatus Woesearchaeota archaeon]|jgi:DNA polymerase III delta subunit
MSVKKPVFWISGNMYDCSEAVNLILDKFGTSNVTILDGTSDGVDRVIINLVEKEIFSNGNKVIRLKGLPENYNIIYDYLKYVNEKCVLIIESPTTTKINGKTVIASSSNLYKEIKKIGKVLEAPMELDSKNCKPWIENLCEKKFKRKIDDESINLLNELKNGNADLIYSEIKKLVTYIGSRRKITLEDVRQITANVIEFDVWKFVDRIIDGNEETCIDMLEDYFLTRENFIYEIDGLMGAILYKVELLLLIKGVGNLTTKETFEALSCFKKKPKDSKEPTVRYSQGMIGMIKSSRNNLGSVRLVSMLSVLYFSLNSVRANSGDASFCKMILLNMVSSLCNRITREKFFSMYPQSREVIFENMQGVYNG